MPFTARKEKGFTRIIFSPQPKQRPLLFILFLWMQTLLLYLAGHLFTWEGEMLLLSCVLSASVSIVVLLGLFVQKSLRLRVEGFSIEYGLLGMKLFARAFRWGELRTVAVEQNRLKTHDIVFVTQKKSLYLHEALSEESCDALLKEIQLFYHYYA